MKIRVKLTSHLIQRIDERVIQTNLDIEETLESMNQYFKKGRMVKEPYGEYSSIFFIGQTFALVVAEESENVFTGITMKSVLHPNTKGERVRITYTLN